MLLTSEYNARSGAKFFSASSSITVVMNVWIAIWLYIILISLSGDVQLICHWNLNSITAHSYAKVSLLEAYIAVQKFDKVCIFETYLDSSTAYDDGNLEITRYNLIRSDHPSNKKRGAVCICYKNSLPRRVFSIHYLQEYINFELKIGDKLCNFFLCIGLRVSPKMNLKNFLKIWKGI